MGDLPKHLSTLSPRELELAKSRRDERMSVLFRAWPDLSEVEMRELKKLSDERQRLASHGRIIRALHALRAPAPGLAATN